MKRNSILVCGVAAMAWAFTGCGGGANESKTAEKSPVAAEAGAYQPTGDEGTVTGKVSFTGTAPKLKAIQMDADSVCAAKHKEAVYPETVVANKNGTLKNVFVYVKTGLEGKTFAVPSDPVTIDQDGCQYKPHVLGIRAKQNLKVVTSDDTTHNIHPMPKVNREWNVSQPPKADPIIQTFSRAEVSVPVKCNQHPWMKAFIHVVDNPFFAVTGDDGTFELKGLPPGNYEIEAVHEQYGAQTMKVTVAAKGAATADFSFKPDQAYLPSSLKLMPALVLH
jgi:hypothetical protein